MIKEAIEYIVGLNKHPIVISESGIEYIRDEYRCVTENKDPVCDKLLSSTLKSVIDYITSHNLKGGIIHVKSPFGVELISPIFGPNKQREKYLYAECPNQQFQFGKWFDPETFIINLLTSFIQDENRDKIISIASGISDVSSTEIQDDGVSQRVTVKAGITTIKRENLISPVVLRPFRSFAEIEQPASPFVFRIRKSSVGDINLTLIEADGGHWKIECISNIVSYLEQEISKTNRSEAIAIIA